jgi:hypothetical protein
MSMYVCACIAQYSDAWHSGALQNYTVAEPCNVDGVDMSQGVAADSLLVCGMLEVDMYGTVFGFLSETSGPPLWSNGQSSWLQIQMFRN